MFQEPFFAPKNCFFKGFGLKVWYCLSRVSNFSHKKELVANFSLEGNFNG